MPSLNDFRKWLNLTWLEWLNLAAAVLTMLTAAAVLLRYREQDVFLKAFLLYFLILLVYLGFITFRYSRKARYAEATEAVHNALHAARDAYHYLEWCRSPEKENIQFDEKRCCDALRIVLTAVSTAFSITSGTRCRATLKVIGQDENDDLYVVTKARDSVSHANCEHLDRGEGRRHLIKKNTDFHLIVEGKHNYFFCNNLQKYPDYLNTNYDEYSKTQKKPWPLPYRSTIVWPIRYVWTKEERDEHGEISCNDDLYAFLTVDSSAPNAFNERHDFQMGAGLADALFPVLDAYAKLMS